MKFLNLIEAKRDGRTLSPDAIRAAMSSFVAREIPDYQMAAFLMAVYFRGLDAEETRTLTLAMRDSGNVLEFPEDPRPLVDKHSTGGVGDKVSLPLAPLLACLGFRVPMISGRGLGITGGTLDKLESIPGFSTALSTEQIVAQVQSVGCVICGQTAEMVPADKALYALRDVTGTVPSIPLITASILSKKLAENISALILDVKFGRAAFMQDFGQARQLAQAMVTLGNQCGVRTCALLTGMDSPLGRAAGHWLEIRETIACLEGRGPANLEELVLACAAHLLVLTGKADNLDQARTAAAQCLASGRPRRKWEQLLAAQGADLDAFNRKLAQSPVPPVVMQLESACDGFVADCDARLIGEVIRDLGGGRLTKQSQIDHEVGLDEIAGIGEIVRAQSVLAQVHAPDQAQAEAAVERLKKAFVIKPEPPAPRPGICDCLPGR